MTNHEIIGCIFLVLLIIAGLTWGIFKSADTNTKPAVHVHHDPDRHARAASSQALEWALREILKEPGNAVRNIALAENALNLFHHKKP